MSKFDKEHLQRFFRRYKRLVDIPLLKSDFSLYQGKLSYVSSLVRNIDYNKNLLILCKQDIVKEVFLSGFFCLDTLRSYDFLNISDFFGIVMGKRNSDSVDVRQDDFHYEDIKDILSDVLCVSCNYYEVRASKYYLDTDALVETLEYRYKYVSSNPRHPIKLNWVFYRGSIHDLKKSHEELYKYFVDKEGHPLYEIVDLNPLLVAHKGISESSPVRVPTVDETARVRTTTQTTPNTDTLDLYDENNF